MFISYLIKTIFEQQIYAEWHTVKVSDCGKFVINAHGIKVGIGPFLLLKHQYHENYEDRPIFRGNYQEPEATRPPDKFKPL